MNLTAQDFKERYEHLSGSAHCLCEFTTQVVGGQPAGDAGLKAFIGHHLKLVGEEAESAFRRIKTEEIGETKPVDSGGELEEKLTYGVLTLRHSLAGPWLGSWMVQACLKQAASRTGLFANHRGSKGDMSEAGRVESTGISLLTDHDEQVHLIGPDGEPAATRWGKFQGRVQTAQGSMSIVHDSELCEAGTRMEFTFRFLPTKITEQHMVDLLSVAQTCGLGSCRSLGAGKFKILTAEVKSDSKAKKKAE